MTPTVAVHDVDVSLGGRPVLRRVDLEVRPGEFVALLGANGSGKSTLVRAAVGLVPFTGSIRLFGTPIDHFKERHRLGYVPQRSAAVTGVPATVREVVASGRLSRRRFVGLASAADRRAVARAIDAVGLSERATSPLVELSGGQQQRVHIARALAGEPELVIMDEPTAGVDHDNTELLAQMLHTLVREGTSVLLVAHELGPMRPLIDRAVVMDAGRVAHDGPVEGLAGGQLDAEQSHAHAHEHTGQPGRLRPLPGEGVW